MKQKAIFSVTTAPEITGLNEVMTYTLSITNHGPSVADSIVITDSLPAETACIDAFMNGGGSCAYSAAVTCTLPELASGDSVTAVVAANTPASAMELVNQAQVNSATLDLNSENNAVTTKTAVVLIRHIYLPVVLRI